MIAFIQGKIDHKEPSHVVVNVGGVGYEIKISVNTYTKIKSEESFKFTTYLHVREDAQILYGFSDGEEKKLFLHLISVSGIGPNTALTMLSSMEVNEIRSAIVGDDVKAIQSVKGIGLKTAQRVILDLKDKIQKEGLLENAVSGGKPSIIEQFVAKEDALAALISLGFNKATAEKNIDAILKKSTTDITSEELIKAALKAK